MNQEKLLQNPLPIDRNAYRVVREAKPEDVWQPMPKEVEHITFSTTAIKVQPLPKSARKANPQLASLPGRRRDRMTIIGYAAEQTTTRNSVWVVRCDCGNYETRTRILRWVGTAAYDMCRECRTRKYKMVGEWAPREPAHRETVFIPRGRQE